jgi:CDP-diglyceride synthetase
MLSSIIRPKTTAWDDIFVFICCCLVTYIFCYIRDNHFDTWKENLSRLTKEDWKRVVFTVFLIVFLKVVLFSGDGASGPDDDPSNVGVNDR